MRAMILAAGRGERMRPLTDTTPRPLLKAGGRPLIVHHIERLVAAGLTELIINHAWLGEQIEQTLGDGRQWGAHITYSAETQALETAGGIAQALPFFADEPFLVINGDIWCDWSPAKAHEAARQLTAQRKSAWLLLVDNPNQHPHGDFILSADGSVHDKSANSENLTFAGIGVYCPSLFQDLPPGRPAPLAPLLRREMAAGRVIGQHHNGAWIDVGTPQRLAHLDHRLSAQT